MRSIYLRKCKVRIDTDVYNSGEQISEGLKEQIKSSLVEKLSLINDIDIVDKNELITIYVSIVAIPLNFKVFFVPLFEYDKIIGMAVIGLLNYKKISKIMESTVINIEMIKQQKMNKTVAKNKFNQWKKSNKMAFDMMEKSGAREFMSLTHGIFSTGYLDAACQDIVTQINDDVLSKWREMRDNWP
jgi:hypothetical protein